MSDTALQTTALTGVHEAADARMAPFAGWSMPVEFAGTLAEHAAVRERAGVFDVSHLGTVLVTGPEAAEAIGHAFTCDASTVAVGTSQYTMCCDEQGGVVDDLIVYRLEEERWMVVPNAANTAVVVERLREVARRLGEDNEVEDHSTSRAILAVQGPDSLQLASRVLGLDVGAIPYLGLQVSHAEPSRGAVVVRTGYTGEVGCEVVAPNELAPTLWQGMVDAGAEPCGLGARDTLRLEMGYPLHGHELSTAVNPYEARMGWAVKLDHDFVGREALAAIRERGVTRRLWGLRTDGRRPLREGLAVMHEGGRVGTTTSGSFSPTLQVGIGLAYLDDPVAPGDSVVVDVRGREVEAMVARPPFVDRDPRG